MIQLSFFTNRKSQVLIFVILLLLIAGLLGASLADMWQAEINMRDYEKYGITAFYLAQAAIERAKIDSANNPLLSGWRPNPAVIPACFDGDTRSVCSYQDLSGGWYRFNTTNLGGNLRRVESEGRAVSSSNNVLGTRKLTVDIDIGGRTQIGWTWKEM